jgi:hypothetical protein
MTHEEWLAVVPFDDLQAELLRRGDHILVATLPPVGTVEGTMWAYRGDHLRVIGLLEELKQNVLERYREAKLTDDTRRVS